MLAVAATEWELFITLRLNAHMLACTFQCNLIWLCAAQIHDELLFLVRTARLPEVARLVRDVMQGSSSAVGLWDLSVALPVKMQVGPSWGELNEYDVA